MRVGVISTQRLPSDPYTWLNFHVDVGIRAFYIRFEDSPGLGEALENFVADLERKTGKNISFYYEDNGAVDRRNENNFLDILTRQSAWVDRMIVKAHEEGVEWVFHIDDDELLYPGSRKAISTWPKVLEAVPKRCASIHLQNWEGFSPEMPVASWARDPGVRYLPRKCAGAFSVYANGKGASRTYSGQSSHGVHHFKGGKECELAEGKGVVLHHDSLAMGPTDVPPEAWVRKHELRIGDDMSRIPFEATRSAVAAVQRGNPHHMRQVWEKYRSVAGERFKSCPAPVALKLPSHAYGPQ